MTNEKYKKISVAIGVLLLFLFLGFYMTNKPKEVSTSSDIELQESDEFNSKMVRTEYETAEAVENNFNMLRQYISHTDMLFISAKQSGFTDGLEQRDLELLKAFEQKGYIIKASTLFVPFEYDGEVIEYEFDLVADNFDERVSVIASFDVETEQLFELDYDTDINEVD